MTVKHMTLRKYQRRFIHNHINYIHDHGSHGTASRVSRGITINESPGGMCLYVYRPLAIGDRLRVSSDMYSEPSQSAIVRWVQEVDTDIYKAGLMFD